MRGAACQPLPAAVAPAVGSGGSGGYSGRHRRHPPVAHSRCLSPSKLQDALEEVAEAVLMVEESYVTRDAGYKPRGLACFFFPKREGLADDEHQLQLQALSSLFTTVPDDSLYVCHYEARSEGGDAWVP